MSLYLPDCTIGALSKAPDAKFVISGKDAGGMKVIFCPTSSEAVGSMAYAFDPM